MVSVFSTTRISLAVDMPSPFWTTKTSLPASRGQAAIICGDNGLIYVMSGFDGSGPAQNTVYAYDPDTDSWANKASMPWVTRGAAVAKGLDGIIYVIGGYNDSMTYSYPTAVQAYNTTSNTWTIKTHVPVPAWIAAAATGNDGKIYVFGGETPGSLIPSNITQIYDPVANTWTNGTDMPTSRKGHSAVRGADGLIYVIGGYNGSRASSAVEAYNSATNAWTTKANMPIPKTEFGAVLGPDNKIYVIGGGDTTSNNASPFYNSVEIYDPEANTWAQPSWSESFMPTARKETGAALSKNGKIYVIGGANGIYLSVNEEATIVMLENQPPVAYIDLITPNPANKSDWIAFTGHGSDSDGSIMSYNWRSSLNGTIGTTATLNISTLSEGTHNIYFSVMDNSGAWSPEVSATVIMKGPITEDPLYQKMQDTNDALSSKINDLEQQNANLTDTTNSLSQKVDNLTMLIMGTSIITIILIIVTIAAIFMKRKPQAATT